MTFMLVQTADELDNPINCNASILNSVTLKRTIINLQGYKNSFRYPVIVNNIFLMSPIQLRIIRTITWRQDHSSNQSPY